MAIAKKLGTGPSGPVNLAPGHAVLTPSALWSRIQPQLQAGNTQTLSALQPVTGGAGHGRGTGAAPAKTWKDYNREYNPYWGVGQDIYKTGQRARGNLDSSLKDYFGFLGQGLSVGASAGLGGVASSLLVQGAIMFGGIYLIGKLLAKR